MLGKEPIRIEHAELANKPIPELKAEIVSLQEQNHQLRKVRAEAEEQFVLASRLFVALSRMNLAHNRQEAITTLTEILTNLIGTEQFACIAFHKHSGQLACLFSMGVENESLAKLSIESELSKALLRGETVNGTLDADNSPATVTAVPLMLRDEAFGAILVFGLLPQKNELERMDHALLELLSKHAAPSLTRRRELPYDAVTQ